MKLIKFIIIVAIMVALPFTITIFGNKTKSNKQNQSISYKPSESPSISKKEAGYEF